MNQTVPSGQPAIPPSPPNARGCVVTALLLFVGIVLLLPGVCALFFASINSGPVPGDLAGLWLVSFAISAGGIALIVYALRR